MPLALTDKVHTRLTHRLQHLSLITYIQTTNARTYMHRNVIKDSYRGIIIKINNVAIFLCVCISAYVHVNAYVQIHENKHVCVCVCLFICLIDCVCGVRCVRGKKEGLRPDKN